MHDFRIRRGTAVALGALLGFGSTVLSSWGAAANPFTTQMEVSAQVQQSCTVDVTDMGFGSFFSDATELPEAISFLTVTCGSINNISIELGQGAGLVDGKRAMRNGNGSTLTYELFYLGQDGILWGDGTASIGNAQAESSDVDPIPIYGRIASGQTPTAGSYTDSVTITVTLL
jgi:spore coat protein U-like protein